MRTRRRSSLAATALLLTTVLGTPSRAEVSAETDAYGNYVRTTILSQASVRQCRIWRVLRRHVWGAYPLNPDGDRNGDQFPTIGENPENHNYPWAMWSRFNGYDYDLAWSRWERGGWTSIQWVGDNPEPGDDLGPALAFDTTGRPYAAWWRDDGGTGTVYLSMFLVTRWMTPFAISEAEVDSRYPAVAFLPDGSLQVRYQTATGPEVRIIGLTFPDTITDDFTPFGTVTRISPQTGDP